MTLMMKYVAKPQSFSFITKSGNPFKANLAELFNNYNLKLQNS